MSLLRVKRSINVVETKKVLKDPIHNITSYTHNGVQVFLKAGTQPAEHTEEGCQTEVKVDSVPEVITMDTGASLEMGRLGALVTKYVILAWRGKLGLLLKVCVYSRCVCVTFQDIGQ